MNHPKQLIMVSKWFTTAPKAMEWARKQTNLLKYGSRLYVIKVENLFYVTRSIIQRDRTERRMICGNHRTEFQGEIMSFVDWTATLTSQRPPWIYDVTTEKVWAVK